MTSAYSAFANEGLRMKPFYITRITDRDGNVIEEARPAARDAVRADTAYLMTSMLRGVVKRGHGGARPRPQAAHRGQDGDDQRFHRCLVHRLRAQAWPPGSGSATTTSASPSGPHEEGSRAALPMWMDFWGRVMKDRPVQDFPIPGNIVFAARGRGRASGRAGGDRARAWKPSSRGPSPARVPGRAPAATALTAGRSTSRRQRVRCSLRHDSVAHSRTMPPSPKAGSEGSTHVRCAAFACSSWTTTRTSGI